MAYNFLIIEDSIPIRTAIKEIVKSPEFIVKQSFEASNGNEGLKILNEEIIDLVLFDFNTPDIDVFRFLDVMKKDESYKCIPTIIIITERSNPKAEGLLEKHSIDYIKQPVNPIEIKQKLNHFMKEEYEVEENQI
ncbi:MAG: response regulator [Deltaproteobacteria bacterium]|nr:response regulator [Deltaproteobacteria bacterium]MBW2680159.1 response regulator [Deltaproteobacteria bacterium]